MADTLKTQTVSFSGLLNDEQYDEDTVEPTARFDSLTTHQMNTIQVRNASQINNQTITPEQLNLERFNAQTKVINDGKRIKGLKAINPYYQFIPRFYLKEFRRAKWSLIYAVLFFVTYLIFSTVISLLVAIEPSWKAKVSPYILVLLIPLFIVLLITMIININRYRNFHEEAKRINFLDDKVVSTNIQRVYRRLKTSFVDINWFSFLSYVLLLLTMLIDSIAVIFSSDSKLGFADFNAAWELNKYTYAIVFYSCVGVAILILILHIFLILTNYLRSANIENYYNYMIVDQNELTAIKRKKNIRDLFIFLLVIGTVIFLTWLIFRFIRRKRTNNTNIIVK
ncbi:MAG: hypothetical protein B1217_0315 [Candidatus Malacoplasma girerdii]|nr:MAG: hypothetical protein B1217_0315 [Candidatus Malacoplasma girerdii]